ncbi:MAG: hypothetical protein A3J58_01890 [Candidatus Sungbacteria bacterium RIFCSPHIGHO2_02_FULL_52_23]|uniref:DUF5667 domain-containing protein n=1 Tax=Candidatus Sungbacteria bacterium RIFCSPHIGHO2_02_FULL_52_23 TaxID=1802274 RepID=A0A1G2KSV8_9BACT|nr:MAG: hypothetical protein A3J58_01890 [Candidatus Sungbacteria bacterium RIFCSPHIGHO2_02_FULL_52_23]
MKNKLSLIVSVSAAVLMPFAALAHEAVAAETSTEQRQQMQVDRQKGLDAAKTERAALEEKARQMRDEVKSKQEELRREMQTRMEELKKKRQEVEAEMKKKREEFQTKMEERKMELKKKLGEQKAVRIEQYFSQMMEKFQTAIDRLKGVADKIESRLTSSTADPANLAVLQTKLTAARAKIGEAEAALADAKVKYTDAVNSTDFKESFKKVRALVEGVAVKVKEAHRALVDVTSSIKELGARGRSSSTTTPAQ